MAAIDEQEPPMQLISLWFKRPRHSAAARHLARPAKPPELPVLEEDELPLGCGWFDSSHELRAGLVIVEADPLAWQRLH
jgi:hypothetical protein